jgi:putative membrane protein
MPTLVTAIMAFAMHLGVALASLGFYVLAYTRSTPYEEIALVRKGNVGAAVALAGGLIGYAIVLSRATTYSTGIVDAVVWGLIGLVIQIAGHRALSLALPRLYTDIEDGELAPAIVKAGLVIALGLLSAASMTP